MSGNRKNPYRPQTAAPVQHAKPSEYLLILGLLIILGVIIGMILMNLPR